jgi:hypothetical protein
MIRKWIGVEKERTRCAMSVFVSLAGHMSRRIERKSKRIEYKIAMKESIDGYERNGGISEEREERRRKGKGRAHAPSAVCYEGVSLTNCEVCLSIINELRRDMRADALFFRSVDPPYRATD